MSKVDKNKTGRGAKNIARIAVMAATITGGKLALAFLPNVEIVTLLCALYGYIFGPIGLAAVFIFVTCEMVIWGIGTWVASYFIYWPLVCCVFWLLAKVGIKNRVVLTLVAVALTVFFGILTSLVEVGLFMGVYHNFWQRFWIYYVRGIRFYVAQIAGNIAGFAFLFRPAEKALSKYKPPRKPKKGCVNTNAP